MITLFVIFRKRKNLLLTEKKDAEKYFEQEISKTQIEIREETFRNISWELHDNIGQLVTLAKIQLQNDAPKEEVKETLNKSLRELRTLSKVINPDVLKKMSLVEAISYEVDRFNRLNFISASLNIEGKEVTCVSAGVFNIWRVRHDYIKLHIIECSKPIALNKCGVAYAVD